MDTFGVFPFGQPVRAVEQTDRTPKRVFVLGVYSSAVHARWRGVDGKPIVSALAVASEPCIFWTGDVQEAVSIIGRIEIPPQLGRLEPASSNLNGPSGVALDEQILKPLQLSRSDAWLCDLVPHSCANPSQLQAVRKHYDQELTKHGLPAATVPPVPKVLADDQRRAAIAAELQASGAETLILLGDQPIKWFLHHFDSRWKRLDDFSPDQAQYGQLWDTRINGRSMHVLPLAHPRQIAGLGFSSGEWRKSHKTWIEERAGNILP